MRYSKAGIVAVLIAAELLIAGIIIFTIGGLGRGFNIGNASADTYHASVLPVIDAGSTPHITVDDADSRVIVSASSDGKVHVTDATFARGWGWGSKPAQLRAQKTPDGVAITRPSISHVVFGFYIPRTEIAIPPGSNLEIRNAGGTQIADLTGPVSVSSGDGSITAHNLSGEKITLRTGDGSMRLDGIRTQTLDATTSDGSIRATGINVSGGWMRTRDGSIRVDFASGVNLKITASTNDGSIRIDGQRQESESGSTSTQYTIGNGNGSFDVSTHDGSIRISTNGA